MEICMPLAAVLLMIFFVSSSALIQKTLSTLYATSHFYHRHRLLNSLPLSLLTCISILIFIHARVKCQFGPRGKKEL